MYRRVWRVAGSMCAPLPFAHSGIGPLIHGTTTMRLSPREEDHLVLHAAGALAQKRLARGLRLNYSEAVALLASQVRLVLIS